ncbi:DUF2380 domain-containing protein [Stieleria neptunia]|uniref:DUF2380 domain-containing protein n=1 Tax=Stieleria neptunia TaxID=2527979 RepID=UPI001E5969CF|nr:DUF2380 domain-containing protein [Stieleria neptunia]
MLTADGKAARLEWISAPYMAQCELRNIEVEQVHRYQVGHTPTGGLWTHNGMENGCQVPRAKTSLGIDDALREKRIREISPNTRVIKAAPDAEHHIFLQHLRKRFKDDYGIDVDDYVVDVDDLTHQALHAGRGPLGIKAGWWEQELMAYIRDAETIKGSKLDQAELLQIAEDILSRFDLPGLSQAHRYSKA